MRITMCMLLFGLIAMNSIAADVAEEQSQGERALRESLAIVAGTVEALQAPGAYQARLLVESYNQDDGIVREEIVETIGNSPQGRGFRADHQIVKPEQSPKSQEVRVYRIGERQWKLVRENGDGMFLAQETPLQLQEPKAVPYVLRFLAYALANPDRFEVTCGKPASTNIDETSCLMVPVSIAVGSDSIAYEFHADAGSKAPLRIVTLENGFVTDFRGWRRFGELHLPQRTTEAAPAGGREITTTLEEFRSDPDLPGDFFELPAHRKLRGRL